MGDHSQHIDAYFAKYIRDTSRVEIKRFQPETISRMSHFVNISNFKQHSFTRAAIWDDNCPNRRKIARESTFSKVQTMREGAGRTATDVTSPQRSDA